MYLTGMSTVARNEFHIEEYLVLNKVGRLAYSLPIEFSKKKTATSIPKN